MGPSQLGARPPKIPAEKWPSFGADVGKALAKTKTRLASGWLRRRRGARSRGRATPAGPDGIRECS